MGNISTSLDDTILSFVRINKLILPEIKQNLPSDFTNCFERLADKQGYASGDIKTSIEIIRNYHDTITDITILPKVGDDTDTSDLNHEICSSLKEFTEKISEYAFSFECFNNLYEKYYIPFQNNSTKIDNLLNDDYDKQSIVKRYRL